MSLLRISLGFANTTDTGLGEFTVGVLLKFYGNTAYPAPPVTSAAVAANLGGPAQTAAKDKLRAALIGLVRQLAGCVQEKHGNDLAVLFRARSRASVAWLFDQLGLIEAPPPGPPPTPRPTLTTAEFSYHPKTTPC